MYGGGVFTKLLRFVHVAALLLLPMAAIAQVQVNQVFNLQGPSPSIGQQGTVQSGDIPPNSGSVAGAVQAVVFDPTNSNIYVGTPGGGIWASSNGGAGWTPLTDKQATLSIYSLSLDPTDARGKTLIAGTGVSSNGTIGALSDPLQQFQSSGGIQNGLLYSQDGGKTWTSLGGGTLAGQNVSAVAARGQIIMAGTSVMSEFAYQPVPGTISGALYRSTNGGTTFMQVSGAAGTGLPAGPITSLVGDPGNPNTFYAALSSPTATSSGYTSTAIYMSTNSGSTWSQVFNASNSKNFDNNVTITGNGQTMIKLATGANGAVAAGVVDVSSGRVTGLFWSSSPSTGAGSWTALRTPAGDDLNYIKQAPFNFAIAIDPTNSKLVYISGDETKKDQTTYSLAAYRVSVADQTITGLTLANTANGTFPHSDSRAITFDSSGNLILTSDGSIYLRTSPQTDSGNWQRVNGDLSAFEVYKVAYDAVSKRLSVAAQDNGVAIQSGPGNARWNAVQGADGLNVAINDTTLTGKSAVYSTFYSLGGFSRIVLDASGKQISPNTAAFGYGAQVTCNKSDCASQVSGSYFYSPVVLNKVNPTLIAMAGSAVYVAQDTLTGKQAPDASTVNLNLTNVGSTGANSSVTALAYGTIDNNNVLLAGVAPNGQTTQTGGGAGQLWLSTSAAANSLAPLAAFTNLNAFSPSSVVFDQRSQSRFYVADGNQLFGTGNQGAGFQPLTGNLPANFIRPTSLEFISNNGVNALLVGGLNNVANAQGPIAVADSNANGNLAGWRPFGQGLPNSQVSALSYNPTVDVLAVGTFGRGVAALYDVTSYFPQATALQFGLANNDSTPDASYLTNGTTGGRPLNKYGSGILTIAGGATYMGGTTIFGGAILLGTGGSSGSILGSVAFCSDGANPLCDASTNKFLAFNRSDTYTFAGSISGPGQLVQAGSGTTILTGTSTYAGPTNVNAGTLAVNGSISSSVFVNFGATLAGAGTVGATQINGGGTLAPGPSARPAP
jgi:autotransporter-associated beta strand protein